MLETAELLRDNGILSDEYILSRIHRGDGKNRDVLSRRE